MIILACGGRNYNDTSTVFQTLDALHESQRITLLVHGAATGADTLAAEWAVARGVTSQSFPADWRLFGRAAGPRRNEHMLAVAKPDLVVAFPGGSGTFHMCMIARQAGVPVTVIA